MLKNRHVISYFSTTLIYVTIIGSYFYLQSQTKISTQRSDEKVMQVRLTDFVPEAPPAEDTPVEEEVEEEVIEPEKIKEPLPKEEEKVVEEVIKEPLPKKEEKVVEEVIPEPIVKPQTPLPKPVVEKPIPKEPIQKKPEEKPKKIEKPKVDKKKPVEKPKKRVEKKKKPVKKSSRASSQRTQANPDKVNKFYKKIRVKINQNKSYPKIAKRRRMQGSVKVSFTVTRSGNVSNIQVSGPKVFHNSARHAVQSAFPISTKNVPISLPAKVNVTLRYQIR